MQNPAQKTSEFDFDFELDADLGLGLNTHISTFGASAGLMNSQSLNELEVTTSLTPAKASFEPAILSHSCLPQGQYPHTYESTNHSSLPSRHTLEHPELQGYYRACETPYFDNYFNALPSSVDTISTPNLTTTLENGTTVVYENSQYSSRPYARPTESWLPHDGVISLPIERTEYVPFEASLHDNIATRFVTRPHEGLLTTACSQPFETGPVVSSETDDIDPGKSSHDHCLSGFSDGHKEFSVASATRQIQGGQQVPVSDLNAEQQVTGSKKAPEGWNWRRNRNGSVSLDKVSPTEPVKYLPGEKPKKLDSKPWIRTNANTEGDTRTAKINNWKNRYVYKPLPLGTWNSGKHVYKYTQYEKVDFLVEAPMSTRKIKEYIVKYPCDNNVRLILWIQKMPADQGRRYGSKQHSKCIFRDCPIQRYVEGTISTGEYRVAFDEKYFTHGDETDPYDCAAYAHLYCMEQFLDFEQVCQIVDVRVDTRLDMPLEPNGKAAFSMVDVPARYEMEHFINAASKGSLRSTYRWHNYPVHVNFNRGQRKPHKYTLTYLAHCMYEAHQDDSHKKQAALRRVTVSQRRVHLGDLEMSVADKRIINEVFGGKKKGKKEKIEDHYDEHILFHIERAKQEAEYFLNRYHQTKKFGKGGRSRDFTEGNETENEDNMYNQRLVASGTEQGQYASPLRNTLTTQYKKQGVNHANSVVEPQYQHAQISFLQSQAVQAPDQPVQQLETCMTTDFSCEPISTHVQPPVDLTTDTAYDLYTMPMVQNPSCNDLSDTKKTTLDVSNLPMRKIDIPDNNPKQMLVLGQRRSCTARFDPTSTLKSMELLHSSRTPRQAVFDAQPVSSSKEYFANGPSSLVAGTKSESIELGDCNFGRRSARITAKMKWSGEEWRIRKCARLS